MDSHDIPFTAGASVLVVEDDRIAKSYLESLLTPRYQTFVVSSSAEATNILKKNSIDVVLLDLMLADGDSGFELLKKIRSVSEDTQVIVVSGIRMTKTIVSVIHAGAVDYITKPFKNNEILLAIERVLKKLQLQKQNKQLRQQVKDSNERVEIIGKSPAIERIRQNIEQLQGQAVNVLLVGETGTGKELFAKSIHQQEGKSTRPFISLNCAAIPENLLESMLFGHEKGAFTHATERRIGKFELADGGDIFLDEISCLDLGLQAKLLRVLEEKEVERIGCAKPKPVDFRVIAASNENLFQMVEEGRFRRDLLYRLNTVTIHIPNLRSRGDDILLLANHFLSTLRRNKEVKTLSKEVQELLLKHQWRGNVRELRNTIENMIIFSKNDVIDVADLPFTPIPPETSSAGATTTTPLNPIMEPANYYDVVRNVEKNLLLQSLQRNRWNKTRTCKELGLKRNKLYRKMNELGIEI